MKDQSPKALPPGVLTDAEHKIVLAYAKHLMLESQGDRLMRLGVMRALALIIADAASRNISPASAVACMLSDLAHDIALLMEFAPGDDMPTNLPN